MKRLSSGIMIFIIIFSFFALPSYALPESAGAVEPPSNIGAKYVVLMDINSQEVIYQKNADQKMYPASTTKLMTAMLVLENCTNLQEEVVIPASVNTTPSGSSILGIQQGQTLTIDGLMYGLMLKSGNDCAIVLADIIAGGQQAFANMMNQKAAELGMKNTHFTNPHGFHDPDHYTTAEDMAKLALYAYKNEAFRTYVSTEKKTIPFIDTDGSSKSFTNVSNSNKLILPSYPEYYYQYCTGMKTGFHDDAGQCLIATANKDGQELLAAIFYDGLSTNTKYVTAKRLFEYSYERFETIDLTELVNNMDIKIKTVNYHPDDANAGEMNLKFRSNEPVYYTSTKSVIEKIKNSSAELTISQPDEIAAPVSKGDFVGQLELKYNGEVILSKEVIAERSVAEKKDPVSDLVQIELPIAPSKLWEMLKEINIGVYIAIAAAIIIIIIIIIMYRRARRRVSLTRNVYRRERR